MTALARFLLSALLLAWSVAPLAPPAASQAYDTPLLAAAAAKMEQEIRLRVLRIGERPQPAVAAPAATLGLNLVRERKYAEAVPLLERAIAHGGGTFDVWIA